MTKIDVKNVYDIQPLYQYKNLAFSKHPLICTDIRFINNTNVYEFFLAQSLKPGEVVSNKVWLVFSDISDSWPIKSTKINFNQKISITEDQLKLCFHVNKYIFYNGKIGHQISDDQLKKIKSKWASAKQNKTNITLIQNIKNKEVYFYREGEKYAYNTFPHLRNPEKDKIANRHSDYKNRFDAYKQTKKLKEQERP